MSKEIVKEFTDDVPIDVNGVMMKCKCVRSNLTDKDTSMKIEDCNIIVSMDNSTVSVSAKESNIMLTVNLRDILFAIKGATDKNLGENKASAVDEEKLN